MVSGSAILHLQIENVARLVLRPPRRWAVMTFLWGYKMATMTPLVRVGDEALCVHVMLIYGA